MSDKLHVPPSQQSAQRPVPKPGEPVNPTKGILSDPRPVEPPAPINAEPKARAESAPMVTETQAAEQKPLTTPARTPRRD